MLGMFEKRKCEKFFSINKITPIKILKFTFEVGTWNYFWRNSSALTDIAGLMQVVLNETLWGYRGAEFNFYYSQTVGQYFLMALNMQDKHLIFLTDSAALDFLLVLTAYLNISSGISWMLCHVFLMHPVLFVVLHLRFQELWILLLRAQGFIFFKYFFLKSYFCLGFTAEGENPCPNP